jgi:hypothetical protein
LVTGTSCQAADVAPESARYCLFVLANKIATSRWAISFLRKRIETHEQSGSPWGPGERESVNQGLAYANADIDRLTAKKMAAVRFLSKDGASDAEFDVNNSDFARARADLATCDEARGKTDAKSCVTACMNKRAAPPCMDECFAAGSAECRRTSECLTMTFPTGSKPIDH